MKAIFIKNFQKDAIGGGFYINGFGVLKINQALNLTDQVEELFDEASENLKEELQNIRLEWGKLARLFFKS